MGHLNYKNFTLLGLLTVLGSPAFAMGIPAIYIPSSSEDWSYVSTTAGMCLDEVGLGCTYTVGDPLIDPITNTVVNPLTDQPLDDPYWVRAAIYTTYAQDPLLDPGYLLDVAKAEPGGANSDPVNPDNGFTLYTEFGELLTNQEITRGFWTYEGTETLDYLTVKTADRAYVWDINELILEGENNGDPLTPLVGYWELDSWYDLGLVSPESAMSHVSVFMRLKTPPNEVPTPPTLLLFGSLFGFIAWKRRRS